MMELEGGFKKWGTVLITVFLVTFVPPTWGHRTAAYSHENESPLNKSKWMQPIQDNTPLSSLSLPGTHETLSLGRGEGGDIAQCQTLPLETQLRIGIRVLDVRCRHYENAFVIHHGIVYQHFMFGDVLNISKTFLDENPSEVILMRVREEYDPFNNTRTFEETFQAYSDSYPGLFWVPLNQTQIQPTVGEVRGKIVLLDNFSSSSQFGLNYGDQNNFQIQDNYLLETNWDLYHKWELVKTYLMDADSSRGGTNAFFINYLSGSTGVFPFFVASGHITHGTAAPRLSTGFTTLTSKDKYPDFPRVDCVLKVCTIAFEGTNVLSYQLLQKHKYLNYVGIIMADFPGDGLVTEIIQINFSHFQGSVSNCRQWTMLLAAYVLCFFILSCCIAAVLILYQPRRRRSVNVSFILDNENVNKQPIPSMKNNYEKF